MAFGMTIGSKLASYTFRIVAVSALVWYIHSIIRIRVVPKGYLICLALITAGAAGNIFDCVFYGLIFNNPMPPQVASLFPEGGGYAPVFMGKVVDMFYFPLFSFTWPDWVPFVGGRVSSFRSACVQSCRCCHFVRNIRAYSLLSQVCSFPFGTA